MTKKKSLFIVVDRKGIGHVEDYSYLNCKDCGETVLVTFMLTDKTWGAIKAKPRQILCLVCSDKRAKKWLGRSLLLEDFTKSLANMLLFWGFELGLKASK